jgi:predicted nucleic acid-binding protein
MLGLTLDTGALIALERNHKGAQRLIANAVAESLSITVPSLVLVEWWRGQKGPAARLRNDFYVEPLSKTLALVAGVSLTKVSGPSVTDAVVMASAAARGDIVLTGDIDDMMKLRDAAFPGVVLRSV